MKKDETTVPIMICTKNAAESISPGQIRTERRQLRVVEVRAIAEERAQRVMRKLTYTTRVGVASFFTRHGGASFASTCLADPISKQFVASIHRFAAQRDIPVRWTTAFWTAMTRTLCSASAPACRPRTSNAFFRRWPARLPHPFTAADRRAGYRYELSILQAEFLSPSRAACAHPELSP